MSILNKLFFRGAPSHQGQKTAPSEKTVSLKQEEINQKIQTLNKEQKKANETGTRA